MKMTNVNFNQVNKENKTVLTIYMDRLDDKFIEDLVSYGADLNFQNSAGKTTLMYAIESKNNNFISYILKLGASVDVTDYQGLNAWHYAIKASAYKAFMTLLESDSFSRNPSSIDAPDCNGHSPIWHAINTDHPSLVSG
jgi:ankyrin repeat protein